MNDNEQTKHEIPVVGTIGANGEVQFDPAFAAHLDAQPCWVMIAYCIWPLLPAETRALAAHYIRSRDGAGVSCWMPADVRRQVTPEVVRACRRQVIRPGIDFDEFSRYLDLLQHQDETHTQLPISPVVVAKLEAAGAEVDLVTGWVYWPEVIEVKSEA